MSKSLVIVESPAKAKTINKYLGKDYTVEASLGHIKDLPKNEIGVELKHRTFEPELIVIPGKEKVVDRLKKLAAKSESVYLAPDPDREGEAIAAHLAEEISKVVKKNAIHRVTFNEITPKAVRDAFQHARQIDSHLVDAQTTRRVLDRIVGYQVSPLLWDKVRRGLSAGRVQTVAVRLIVEREREIKAFNPVEYWTIDAELEAQKATPFTARFTGIDGQRARVETVDTPSLPDQKTTDEVVAQLKKAAWSVRSVERKERKRNAAAPFTTSKLQQDASRQLGFNVKRTMGVAQRLYEGVDIGGETVGLITYMRTDSTRVAPEAITAVRNWIKSNLGDSYLPESPNAFKSKKDAQDHDAAARHKHRVETETEVKDGEAMAIIFSELGYKPAFIYEKWRTEYADHTGHCVIDETPIGLFAELEGPGEWIDDIGKKLGLDPSEMITLSYGRLFDEWRTKTGSSATDLTFGAIRGKTS